MNLDPQTLRDTIWFRTRADKDVVEYTAQGIEALLAARPFDREALDDTILAWYTAQKPNLDLTDLGDRITALFAPAQNGDRA